MTQQADHRQNAQQKTSGIRPWLSRHGLIVTGFILIAGYFLWTEHRAHILSIGSWLPWLLLALCPLMHLFMHHGHDGHSGHGQDADGKGEDK